MSAEPISLHAQQVRRMVGKLSAKGFRLLRVQPNDKRPFDHGWPERATNDPRVLDDLFIGDYNLGVACGPQPNGLNLVVIDVDTRHGGMETWSDLCDVNDLPYTATHMTPTDGLHYFFDCPFPLNNSGRLPAGIDVRGVGGQVVLPPSTRIIDGKVTAYRALSGRGLWEHDVADMPEWLIDLLRAPVERSIERHPSRPRGTTPGEPLSNADWLRDHWDWIERLEAHGFRVVRQHGEQVYVAHPEATSEHSAIVYLEQNRMQAWSTNMPAPLRPQQESSDGSVTWSPFDWFVVAWHGGDLSAAAREINQMRGFVGISGGRPERAADEAPPVDDAQTLNLPSTFWERRPILDHVRTAAWSAGCSPDALLVHALARVATYVHPSFKLPGVEQGLIGKQQTLDFLGCVVAETSGGKTLAAGVGEMLVPAPDDPLDGSEPLIDFEQKVGSGEGIPEFFLVPEMRPDDDGKLKATGKRIIGKQALFMSVDEGTGFTAQAGRKGTTIIATLASAWSGESLGQLNAAEQTRRLVRGGRVRICAVINMQDTNGYKLYSEDLESVGFTGRLLFASAHDPSAPAPANQPDWPGPLHWLIRGGSTTGQTFFTYAPEIVDEIKTTRHGILTKRTSIDRRQSQYLLLRCKVAALFAVLDGRLDVTADDWALATETVGMSAAVLGHLDATHGSQIENVAVQQQVFRLDVAAKADSVRMRVMKVTWQGKIIERLRKRGPLPWKGLKDLVESSRRVELREALDALVEEGAVTLNGSAYEIGS